MCSTLQQYLVVLFALLPATTLAFTAPATRTTTFTTKPLFLSSEPSAADKADITKQIELEIAEEKRNPKNPNLPEVVGDFDWDEKYKDDPEWITEGVPGKVVLSEVELARQVSALNALEEKWRKERVRNEYEEARLLGWSEQAEMYNGRFAMFFLVVGLLTELWTGISIPGQIEEMARVGGFISFDQ
mmetsp:Transcript_17758/g.22080  ORF Transcript_17758/g.22080 Transcript_17758/m.22080 type:complete len:187 (+) Transcript_17758:152-712(+)|eukprot:CAMPEP_0172518116 /NCGR_PEP_ID=MMETSP1066-20121228/290625_1 /TAXON_ID=671091 /ORGANISM="Coscinodiscus wailesii, Strain CCMP2513" /LENGTH=186 /DNA_ID=CAMNT_0013300441 /DNA_START=128 /DNA_END=688 /DNA_ORIENTATION=+